MYRLYVYLSRHSSAVQSYTVQDISGKPHHKSSRSPFLVSPIINDPAKPYGPFLYYGRIIRLDELGQIFCSSSGLCVSSIKTGTRRIMRPDELPFVVRRSRRISKESSSRRIIRLVPVFILKTHDQSNFKCLSKFVHSDIASLV